MLKCMDTKAIGPVGSGTQKTSTSAILAHKQRQGALKKAKLHQIPVGAKFDRIAIDLMGEMPETENGMKYILVVDLP